MKIKKNGTVINLTESDLKRIVRRVIKEQEEGEPVGGGLNITKGFKFQNGLEVKGATKVNGEGERKVVWIQTEDGGAGQNFSCGRHEQGKYYLTPAPEKHKLTQGESQALYDKYCKK